MALIKIVTDAYFFTSFLYYYILYYFFSLHLLGSILLGTYSLRENQYGYLPIAI